MKFGKEFTSQMVLEWQEAYMDYNHLKTVLKEILRNRQKKSSIPLTPKSSLKKRLSMYRAFSGLTIRCHSLTGDSNKDEDEVILISEPQQDEEEGPEGNYKTTFLMLSEEGAEYELVFFRRLDDEFNKVLKFYKARMEEMMNEAQKLSQQMDAVIALRLKVDYPIVGLQGANSYPSSPDSVACPTNPSNPGMSLDVIQEVEMTREGNGEDKMDSEKEAKSKADNGKADHVDFAPASVEVLNHVKINFDPGTTVSTLRRGLMCSKPNWSFSKKELRIVEEQMKQAFVEFYHKLRLLKSYSFLNLLAFSKIMKKYDKITSRKASKAYLEMVDKSYLGCCDEVTRLIDRVEATFTKHFSNGNHSKGMNMLRPSVRREKHRITFFIGLLFGFSIALVAAIILVIHARNLLKSKGSEKYMDNIFPLYSLFGYILLHMLMFSGNIYFWRRFRVNHSFIFGSKRGTELGYREFLLLSSGLAVLTFGGVLSNLEMDMDPRTRSFKTVTELVPLGLLIVLLLITICPFNIIYRTNRFSFIQSIWQCLCAPLYKVTFLDFFLADQLTSQVQSFRSLEFYVCYYGWGDFKRRSNRCRDSHVYNIFYIIVAVIPYWSRCLQCLRRLVEERDAMQALNGLKYLSTIAAVVLRTIYDLNKGMTWKILAVVTSVIATIYSTYWDVVMDWGLLRRKCKNPWLRDRLLVSSKSVYFAAMVLNVILRLAWMQTVLDINDTPFLHRRALVAVVACLEIIRRGIWNFFRLENEHLNNVGKFRAFKSVPLPFRCDKDL